MPALRKSARDRDFRSQPQKSSTTPYASPTGTPGALNGDKKQRSITEWTEPQPQQLAPSFEEHGFARHGVLENMAPLGVPPKAKDKQRARALGEPISRQALLDRTGISFGDDVGSTPEVTPAPELEPDDSDRQEEDLGPEYPLMDLDEDDDYEPIKPKKKVKISRTPVRGKTPTPGKTPVSDPQAEDLGPEYPPMDLGEEDDYALIKPKKKVKISKTPVRGRHSTQSKTIILDGDEEDLGPEYPPMDLDNDDEFETIQSKKKVKIAKAPTRGRPSTLSKAVILDGEDEDLGPEYPPMDLDNDDDYETVQTKKKTKTPRASTRAKSPAQNKTPAKAKTPVKNGHSKSASVSASPAVQSIQTSQPTNAAQQRMLIAVNDAISRANKNDRRPVGTALKEIFEESKVNTYLAGVLDSIIQQNPTEEQWKDFRVRVKSIRKRIKIENKRLRIQEERFHRHDSQNHAQDSPQASSEVAPSDSASAAYDVNDAQRSPKSAARDTHRALQSALEKKSTASATHPFSTAPALPAAESSAESTPRMSSKSPRKRAATNGHYAQNNETDNDGAVSTTAPTPAAKTPETGGSDSELSEVNEDIVQKGPPEPVQPNGKSGASGPAASVKKGKNLALARAAKKAKASAGKLFGKHAYKHQPPTAEQLAEDERLWEVRKSLVEQQLIRQFDQVPENVSDVRFDDEILETESLTESQIAVGPPVDGDQPQRAGRVPNQGAKRVREDNCRLSSPQLDSTTATRPSTPAVGPAAKRVKLTNGQSARTKRSPVKNRDGGPIAGVAFNGGGGSRQLGPDDNDPNSPQSDSDDFCSACRGPGEFVCCEGCPRVFHLLCCDPPRVEVPAGAFYCYECNARVGSSDATAAESYASLGPLFKSLERINSRAFALPRDVQHHFEGVDARGDGSYFEEVKKFPLAKNSGYGYQKPDYTRTLDGESNTILCTQCGVSSGQKRQMLKCDFCHAYWHLDCVDPPLANPPHISIDASQRDAWRCPRHIEHDLRSGLLLQKDLNDPRQDVEMADATSVVRVARKVRKPKEPEVVQPTFSRGMRNNGLIEIMNNPDDDTDGEGNYVFGPDDPKDLNAKIFRIPEKGLILDFVSKVKSGRVVKEHGARRDSHDAARRKSSMQNFLAHPIHQQQAALNLTQFAKRQSDIDLSEGKVSALLYTLTSEAPPEVVDAIDNANPPPLTAAEREELLKLEELIQRRLKA